MALEYYALVNNARVIHAPVKVYEPPKSTIPELLMDDTVDITLAQFSPNTAGLVVAHKLSDYRRRKFTLVMLPDVRIVLDSILDEVGELGELV